MEVVVSFVIPVLAGVVIGIFSGMLGIGGGTILVPVFRLAFGMSPLESTATSLFTIIPTSLSGALSHIKNKTSFLGLGIAMGIGGACTSPLGVWFATVSPPWMVMTAAAVVIGYSAINMLKKAIELKPDKKSIELKPDKKNFELDQGKMGKSDFNEKGEADFRETSRPDFYESDTSDSSTEKASFTSRQYLMGAGVGLVAGLASGYVGVGGGFIMVPLMLSLLGISMKYASGTSLIAVTILAIPGTIEQGILGNIEYLAGLAVAIGSIPGAVVGAQLVKRIPERALRFIFGGFLILSALLLIINEVQF